MRTLSKLTMAGLMIVVAACGSDGDGDAASDGGNTSATTIATIPITEPPDVPPAFIGSWTVVSANDVDAPDGVTLTVSSGGGVTGFLGCNELFGSIATTGDGLMFVGLSYAEIGCSDTVDFVELVDALGEVTTVDATDGEVSASLSSADGVVVILERSEDIAPA